MMWQPVRATIKPILGLDDEEPRLFSVVCLREWSDGKRTREVFRFSTIKAATAEAQRFVAKKTGAFA